MRNHWLGTILPLALLAFVAAVNAQLCPAPDNAQYPASPLTYPMTSNQYAVQYRVNGGNWAVASVYISVYGGTLASPYEPFTSYLPFANTSSPATSMSFVSVPVAASANVELRVTKLGNGPFLKSDTLSVRPAAKLISANLMADGTADVSTTTPANFAGEQFVLWWNRDSKDGGAVQGLAIFLDPPYQPPANPLIINSSTDFSAVHLGDYSALEFEGLVVLPGASGDVGPEGPGAQELVIPPNITSVYLAPGSWVQGKLRFDQGSVSDPGGQVIHFYGPGVVDSSRFNYVFRQCRNATGTVSSGKYEGNSLDGLATVSWYGNPINADTFDLDGIVITDPDYTSSANIAGGVANNVKVIGWNGDNDGLELGAGSTASNVFVRTGDDSLEMWGNSITITNATVWQNDNGGVVNLGWNNKFSGDGNLVDGLYVVRTDWTEPTAPSWVSNPADLLSNQNDAIIASLMTPTTTFGSVQPPVYRNIFVDDTPRVFLSLKILPPDCQLKGLKGGTLGCPEIDLTLPSIVNLKIENVFTPQSIVNNSIGFQTLPTGFSYVDPNGNTITLAKPLTLTGTMNIDLTNVVITLPDGIPVPLLGLDAGSVGHITTNGANVDVDYSLGLP
jgi:hypothetical protein